MASLPQNLVALAAATFIGTVFTRDPAFCITIVSAFWLFIFGELYYGDGSVFASQYWVNYTIAAVAVAAAVAAVMVKWLGTGRLVDVWLTRSPLPTTGNDWNIPAFLLAGIAGFLATYFSVQASIVPTPIWHNAEATAPSETICIVLAIGFALLALVFIILAGVQTRTTAAGTVLNNSLGVFHMFALAIIILASSLVWLLPNWSAVSGSGSVTAGWVTGATAAVLDIVFLAGGYALEKAQTSDVAGGNEARAAAIRPYDSLFTGASTGAIIVIRVLVIAVAHGLIFVFAGMSSTVLTDNGAAVHDVFWFPHLMLYFVVSAGVYLVLYFIMFMVTVSRISGRKEEGDGGTTSWYEHFSRAALTNNNNNHWQHLAQLASTQRERQPQPRRSSRLNYGIMMIAAALTTHGGLQ